MTVFFWSENFEVRPSLRLESEEHLVVSEARDAWTTIPTQATTWTSWTRGHQQLDGELVGRDKETRSETR